LIFPEDFCPAGGRDSILFVFVFILRPGKPLSASELAGPAISG
jgi:hypothetical protein